MGFIEKESKIRKPAALAYAKVAGWLGGSIIKNCGPDLNGVWTCELVRDGSFALIGWSTGKSQKLAIPKKFNAVQVELLDGRVLVVPRIKEASRFKLDRNPY